MKIAGISVLLALVMASGAAADMNLNLAVGTRDESGSEERLPSISLAADCGPESCVRRPEGQFGVGLDPLYGGQETELSAGIVHYWKRPKLRVHPGGGVAAILADHGYNEGSTGGLYGHTGIGWFVTRRLLLGLDLRSLWADKIEVDESEFSVGYLQISFLMGWRF